MILKFYEIKNKIRCQRKLILVRVRAAVDHFWCRVYVSVFQSRWRDTLVCRGLLANVSGNPVVKKIKKIQISKKYLFGNAVCYKRTSKCIP